MQQPTVISSKHIWSSISRAQLPISYTYKLTNSFQLCQSLKSSSSRCNLPGETNLGEMQLAAVLSNSIFTAFFISVYLLHESEGTSCNVHWIRYMYMRSCGRKKRDSILIGNESLPSTDIYTLLEYLKQRKQYQPLFREDDALVNEILDEDERLFRREMIKYARPHPKTLYWRLWKKMEEKQRNESIFIDKIFHGSENRFGIRGFPEQWNVNELTEQKINKNYRRQIDRLMEQCCKTNQENTCSEDTFRGAC